MFIYSSLYLYTSVSLFIFICGFYPLHALYILLSIFLCLYLPIFFFLSLLCASSLFSEYFFGNLVSAPKSLYQSVFHYNYIQYSSFLFVGRHDCVSISMILSLLFLFANGRYFGTKKKYGPFYGYQ